MATATPPKDKIQSPTANAAATHTSPPPPKVAKTRNRVINSCMMCRKRKVRCDRAMPTCMTCLRGNHHCVYEDRALKNMRAKEESALGKSNLNERIQRLEKLVAEATKLARMTSSGEGTDKSLLQRLGWDPEDELKEGGSEGGAKTNVKDDRRIALEKQVAEDLSAAEKDRGKGTLILDDTNARFVSPLYWALLEEEVKDQMTELEKLNDESPNSQDNSTESPDTNNAFSPDSTEDFDPLSSMMFGTTMPLEDLMILWPATPQSAMTLLEVFFTNVDPMIRIVHRPTLREKFKIYIEGRYNFTTPVSKTFEPLVFAIFFGAAKSMTVEAGELEFGEPLEKVIARFRRGLELSLAKAEFLSSNSMEVLQAFVLLLTYFCRDDDIHKTWSLTGLALRIAQSLGLHREPTLFPSNNMDVIQVELRRRIWHQILILDFRTAESQGQNPTISEDMFDTLMPSNVNDEDLIRGQMPPDLSYDEAEKQQNEKEGFTDMTMQCLRCVAIKGYRKLIAAVYPVNLRKTVVPKLGDEESNDLEADIRRWYEEMRETQQRLYLRHCNVVNILERCCMGLAAVLEWKFWIIYYHRFSLEYREKTMSMEQRKTMLTKSVLLMESLNLVVKDRSVDAFRWHMDSHSAFHGIRHALAEITSRGFQSPEYATLRERAWSAIDEVVNANRDKTGRDWMMLRKMVTYARHTARRPLNPVIAPKSPLGPQDYLEGFLKTVAPHRQQAVAEALRHEYLGQPTGDLAGCSGILKLTAQADLEATAARDLDMLGTEESPFGFIPFNNNNNVLNNNNNNNNNNDVGNDDPMGWQHAFFSQAFWDQWDPSTFFQPDGSMKFFETE